MIKVWVAISALLVLGTLAFFGVHDSGGAPGVPDAASSLGRIQAFRIALFLSLVVVAAGAWVAARRAVRAGSELRPEATGWAVLWLLALGVLALNPRRGPEFWWIWGLCVVGGPVLIGAGDRLCARLPRRFLGIAGVGVILLALTAFFLRMFPSGTWHHVVLADDYGIVHYNTVKDLEALSAGGLYGWDDQVEGGRSLFLNLRTLAPLVWPLLPLGREAAIHVVYLVAWLAFPLLVGLASGAVLRPHTREAVRSARAWGVFAGALFLLTLSANLIRFGMIYSMIAIDLLLLELVLLEGLLRGGRLATAGLAVAVGLGTYVHVAQQAMGVVFLGVVATHRVVADRRGPPLRLLAGAALLAIGTALPFWAQLWIHRNHLAAHYLMGLSPVLLAFQAAGPLETAWLLARTVVWEFPGYFRFLVLGLPLVGAVAAGGRARLGGYVWIAVLAFLGMFLVWIPGWGYSMLRLHFLLPVILAPIAAEVLRTSRPGFGRGALLTGLGLIVAFLPGMDWWPAPHYHAPSLAAVEGELSGTVRDLPGYRVLFENSAGQSPLEDLTRPFNVYPGAEVQRAGPLALASGRTLFAHAGWDPYPYHDLRDAFIVNGAWQGKPLGSVDTGAFARTLRRYEVGAVVVWSPEARSFFAGRPDRYEPLGEVAPRSIPVSVPAYAVFRCKDVSPRGARVAGGRGWIRGRGPFHYDLAVEGAVEGAPITVSSRALPGWSAVTGDGQPLAVESFDDRLGVRAPRNGDFTVRLTYDRRRRDLVAGAGLALLGLALCITGRRRKTRPAGRRAP